jgi:hypothetical protein
MIAKFAALSAPSSTDPLCHMRASSTCMATLKGSSAPWRPIAISKTHSSPSSRLAPIKHSHNLTPRDLNTAIDYHAACRYSKPPALADIVCIHETQHRCNIRHSASRTEGDDLGCSTRSTFYREGGARGESCELLVASSER